MFYTVIFINSLTALSEIKNYNLNKSLLVFRNTKFEINAKKLKCKKFLLSQNRYLYFFQILFLTLLIKIKQKKIIIFHDSHWLILDFFLNFFRVNGELIKIAHLDLNNKEIFMQIDNFFDDRIKINFIKKIIYFLLKKSILTNFDFFTRVGSAFVIITRIKNYKNIISKNKKIKKLKLNKLNKNVLLLGSAGFCSRQYHIYFYDKIISFLSKKKFKFFFKDHPNKINRIKFSHPKVVQLKPELPIELLNQQFQYVIGFDSFSLVTLNSKAVSLLYLLPNKRYYRFSKKYFKDSKGTQVVFPRDFNDLYKVF